MATALQAFDAVAFSLAATTGQLILNRVQQAIRDVLATGAKVRATPEIIRDVLAKAGCLPSNPQYCEMVQRTNMMGAYNAAAEEQRMETGVLNAFPVWRYDGILDGREGADHRPHFGKYYPASVRFELVRGKRRENCRCVSTPIYFRQWQRLKSQGARIVDGYTDLDTQLTPSKVGTATGGGAVNNKGISRVEIPLTPTLAASLPPELGHVDTLQDLTRTQAGREWAAENKAFIKKELIPPQVKRPDLPDTLPIPEPKASTVQGGTVELPSGQPIEFTRHEIGAPSDKIVWVDMAKLDAAWSGDSHYLPPGTSGESEIPGRRANFAAFLSKGVPVQAPRITLDKDGKVSFIDGRHRTATLRDLGLARIPVMVRKAQAAKVALLLG